MSYRRHIGRERKRNGHRAGAAAAENDEFEKPARALSKSRLCVKNLPAHVNEKRLRQIFEAKGEVTDVRIMRTPDKRSRKFGFVGFAEEKAARFAKGHFNNTFVDTSKIRVE